MTKHEQRMADLINILDELERYGDVAAVEARSEEWFVCSILVNEGILVSCGKNLATNSYLFKGRND